MYLANLDKIIVELVAPTDLEWLFLGWECLETATVLVSSHTGSLIDNMALVDTQIVTGLVGLGGKTDPWRAVVVRCSSVVRRTVVLTDGEKACRGNGDEGEEHEVTEHLEMWIRENEILEESLPWWMLVSRN
ncbi:hypothetical protein GCK72_012606 [Caenorhabditis remanei]|uniref:Uncharacterized protein n=1 Tax=Caenorhabditis remanei TaxID=31234 RepID=A0A6A5GNG9_CAERE|nr:hypothetical protein GCK72_012606 [Caenorhabditis remanei]KAF1756153.1 hypothetical protein GCK72_012606 [Caenorhabditis remanei]